MLFCQGALRDAFRNAITAGHPRLRRVIAELLLFLSQIQPSRTRVALCCPKTVRCS
jgi:hypothetical protein